MKEKNTDIDDYSEILDQLNNKENTLKNLNEEVEVAIIVVKDCENDINIIEEYRKYYKN